MVSYLLVWLSRATYIDVTKNYSTDSLLQFLRQFTREWGWTNKIFSDQSSSLVAASKELQDVIKGIDWDLLKRYSVNGNIKWQFEPADSLWVNGATQALVKTVERGMKIMFQAGSIVNQRPIGSQPSTPEDGIYLCPNDLILGRSSTHAPQGLFKERVIDKRRFDHIQSIM